MGEHKEIRGTIKGIGASPTEAERFVYELLNRINKKKKIKLKIEVKRPKGDCPWQADAAA